jgi:hypothetical protein
MRSVASMKGRVREHRLLRERFCGRCAHRQPGIAHTHTQPR